MIKKIFKENWNYLVVILFLILLFHLVINSSWYNTIISFDNSFFESINDFRSEPLTIIFRIFTFFGEIYIPLAILICLFFAFKKKWIFAFQAGIQIHGEEASETYSEEELKSTIDNLSFIKTASIMFVIFFIGGFIVFKKKIISAMIPGLIWITILFLLTRDSIPWYIVVLCILLLFPGSVLAEFIAMKEK